MAVRLLFVDDESGIRETLPAILSRHGFEVTVHDGALWQPSRPDDFASI